MLEVKHLIMLPLTHCRSTLLLMLINQVDKNNRLEVVGLLIFTQSVREERLLKSHSPTLYCTEISGLSQLVRNVIMQGELAAAFRANTNRA